MPDEFDLDARLFMAVRRAAGSEESRYYLRGILIEPNPDGGAWIVATNGFAMMVGRDRTAVAPRAALVSYKRLEVDTDDWQCAESGCMNARGTWDGGRCVFALENGPAVLRIKFGTTYDQPEGVVEEVAPATAFPPWRRVWLSPAHGKKEPLPKGCDTWGLRPSLLQRLADDAGVRVLESNDGGPSVILFDENPDLVGLLMPRGIRSSGAGLAEELRAAADAWIATRDAKAAEL